MAFPSAIWTPEAGTLEIDASPDATSCSIAGKIGYDNLSTLLTAIFPGADYGDSCPVSGLTHLRASRMKIGTFGKKSTSSNGIVATPDDGLKVAIGYTTVPSQDLPGQGSSGNADPITLLEHRLTSSVETIEIGVEGLKWNIDDKAVENDVQGTYKIVMSEHEITRPRWKFPPFEAIKDLLGTVNLYPMSFQTGPMYTETVLFMGVQLQRAILSNGDGAWRVSYRFSERRVPDPEATTAVFKLKPGGLQFLPAPGASPVVPTQWGEPSSFGGWNHFWRKWEDGVAAIPVYPGFYRLNRANNEPIYTLGDHRRLFPNTQ